jgi:uncharacterized protein
MPCCLRLLLLIAFCPVLHGQANIVISQIYGGGGNTGAPFRNDFIELFNRGTNAVNISGWSVQYASGAGSTWLVTPLAGTIAPGRYYLIQQASGGANGSNLPPADATGSISMSASAGKIALVTNTSPLTGICPLSDSRVRDLIGYGTAASCYEGASAPSHGNTTSLRRAFDGCTDTQTNAVDFLVAGVLPRNSASPPHGCDVNPRAYALHELQGSTDFSPLADQFVTTTTNVVTAVRNNGFFIQSPPGAEDADPLTSEGMFVFTGDVPGTNIVAGNAVTVSGTLTEFRTPSDPLSPTRTQLNAASIQSLSASNALPEPILLTTNDVTATGGQLEKFEGMRVRVNSLIVVGPTKGFLNEPAGTATSDGVFHAVITGSPRPFREAGIDVLSALPSNAPCCVPRFNGNPEILRVDSNGQLGASSLQVEAGMFVPDLTSVLFYEARRYTLLPDPAAKRLIIAVSPGPPPPAPGPRQVALASINLQRFYDATDDANVSDVILSPSAYSNRLHKAALLLDGPMHRPDIVGVAEVENLSVLRDLAAAIPSSNYGAWLSEGNDIGGIDVGFLVNTTRVQVLELRQEGKASTFTHPTTGAQVTLHDRPPLVLRARIPDPGSTNVLPLTVIMNHLRSMLDIEDAQSGAFVRAKRRAQAEFVAQLAQQLQTNGEDLVVMGDFNAFEVNDGYADVMGTIKGAPAPPSQVVLASPDLVAPDLANLVETLPAHERYSFSFDGTAQAIDHALVTRNLRPRVAYFGYARSSADFPETYRNDPARPERVSDHDPVLLYLTTAPLAHITSLAMTSDNIVVEGEADTALDVERSIDLISWSKIGSAVPDETQRFSFTDFNPVSGAAFYRLRAAD